MQAERKSELERVRERKKERERGIANESTKESAHFTQLKLLPAIFLLFVAAAKRHLSVSVTASFLSWPASPAQPRPAKADADAALSTTPAARLVRSPLCCCCLGSPFTFHSQVTFVIIKK